MGNPVAHWEIIGPDGSKLRDFYTQLFGWSVEVDEESDYGMVDTGANKGINGAIGSGDEEACGVALFVEVHNLQEYLAKAVSLGGTVLMEPLDMGDVSIAAFRDPGGNRTGLMKQGA